MSSLLPTLLALALSSAPDPVREPAVPPLAAAPARALGPELGTSVALLTGGYSFQGGRWEDAYVANTMSARFLLDGFTLDGGLFTLLPLERGGPGASTALTARLGYTGERWSVVGGAVVGLGFSAQPRLQLLPSAKGLYRFGPVALEAGLFDLHGQVPAHLGASYGPVGLAYVFPLGGRARVDIPLSSRLGLRAEGFIFQYGGVRTSLLSVGVFGRPAAFARTGDAS